jgi:hypothetical protein
LCWEEKLVLIQSLVEGVEEFASEDAAQGFNMEEEVLPAGIRQF